ncbi:MAG: LEA type 2 family protein [Xanthomonadales bacterium]|nr:LEA type 2 family protein [Xanthomonadales bacterium]
MKSLLSSLFLLVLLPGCATMSPDYEEPSVAMTSFRALPSEGMVPAFEVGLRIINPNSQDLDLQGIVYTISLEGHELVKGVGKDFPVIEAYTQEDVTLTASVQLLSGLRLVNELMRSQDPSMNYAFEAKLDLGGLYPSIRISESGEIDLAGTSSPR